jgi:hypothetical protein
MTTIAYDRNRGKSNFTEFKKEFLNPSLYLARGVGSEDGKRQ